MSIYLSTSQPRFGLLPAITTFLRLIRISNWIKNVAIFFPLIFAQKFLDSTTLQKCVSGFIVFSLLASCIYIINDILDVESDRTHPIKRNRPIANNSISIKSGLIIVFVLLSLAIFLSSILLEKASWVYLIIYFCLNLMYSMRLKKIGLLDIFIIAFFFEIRLYFGGVLAAVTVSHWLCMLTFFLATFIAFSKRYDDVVLSSKEKQIRESTVNYNTEFLKAILLLLASAILVIYMLYSIADNGGERYSTNFYQTTIFVFLGICRYLQLIFVFLKTGNPVKIFYTDSITLLACIAWLLSTIYLIYY